MIARKVTVRAWGEKQNHCDDDDDDDCSVKEIHKEDLDGAKKKKLKATAAPRLMCFCVLREPNRGGRSSDKFRNIAIERTTRKFD